MKILMRVRSVLTRLAAGAAALMVASANGASGSFNGFAFAVPCTIECEQFDTGGQGVAYGVLTNVNLGGKYRTSTAGVTEGVSLYRSTDYGGAAGYCVGNTWPNEWFQYTTGIFESAQYRIEVRARIASASSSSSTTFHFNWI